MLDKVLHRQCLHASSGFIWERRKNYEGYWPNLEWCNLWEIILVQCPTGKSIPLWLIWPCNFSPLSFALSSHVYCIHKALPKHKIGDGRHMHPFSQPWRKRVYGGGWHQVWSSQAQHEFSIKQGQACCTSTGSSGGPRLGQLDQNLGVTLPLLNLLPWARIAEVYSPLDVNDYDIKYSDKSFHELRLMITRWNQNEL